MNARRRAQVQAARARIELDRKIGRPTPQWIVDLAAEGDRDR